MNDSAKNDNGGHPEPDKDKKFVIKVDRTEYKVREESLTGAKLRTGNCQTQTLAQTAICSRLFPAALTSSRSKILRK